jgi:hypothetical protein
MDRPVFNELHTRQNYVYATDVLEARSNKPLTATNVLEAVTEAFIMGAGGYNGSTDAATMLEDGGLAVLLEHLGLSEIDAHPNNLVDAGVYEEAVRAAVDFGAKYDVLAEEIPEGAISDAEFSPDGTFSDRFKFLHDGEKWNPPDWRSSQ